MSTEKFVITPGTDLHFKGPYDRMSTIHLGLENKSTEEYIAFKVKTLDVRRYIVKPTNGIISPGSCLEVSLTLRALPNLAAIAEFLASNQKFLVQYRILATPPGPSDTGYTLLAKRDGNPPTDCKLMCTFDPPTEDLSYKSTHDGSTPVVSKPVEVALVKTLSEPKGDTAVKAVTPSNLPVVASNATRCPLGRFRYLFLLVIIFLMLAMLIAFKYSHKLKDLYK